MFKLRSIPSPSPPPAASSPASSSSSQLELVLKHRLSNKTERAQYFTHAQYGNSLRCLQAIFEYEEEAPRMDRKLRLLHARKLLSTFVESGARCEIASVSKETRAKTMLASASSVPSDLFSKVKHELLNEIASASELPFAAAPRGGCSIPSPPAKAAEEDKEEEDAPSSSSCSLTYSPSSSSVLDTTNQHQRVIAVLDDNAMVRLTMQQKTLPMLLGAHARSFVRGQNKHECQAFVDEILAQRVDLAIVDENLEFDEDGGYVEYGHNIGVLARQRGFRGCLILHTTVPEANFAPAQLVAFNGFVEKCDGKQFAEQVNRIWRAFRASSVGSSN